MDKLKLAEKMVKDAKECIKKGDAVQASEKIYKAVEECIKILAEKNKLTEYKGANKEDRWRTHLLVRAANNLKIKLKEDKIEEAWAIAYNLHVWGFHEHKVGIEVVASGLPYAEWILNYTKNSA